MLDVLEKNPWRSSRDPFQSVTPRQLDERPPATLETLELLEDSRNLPELMQKVSGGVGTSSERAEKVRLHPEFLIERSPIDSAGCGNSTEKRPVDVATLLATS